MAVLNPDEKISGGVYLPGDGSDVHVTVRFSEEATVRSGLLGILQNFWSKVSPQKSRTSWAIFDQRIRCPKRLPDGTVNPPKLLPKNCKAP